MTTQDEQDFAREEAEIGLTKCSCGKYFIAQSKLDELCDSCEYDAEDESDIERGH